MRGFFFLLAVLFTVDSFALTSTKHFCRIQIQLEKISGETQNIQFSSPLKTKEECKALAQLHRKNFDPDKIKTKRVSFFWKKTTKNIPMLAKAKAKKQKFFKKSKKNLRRS